MQKHTLKYVLLTVLFCLVLLPTASRAAEVTIDLNNVYSGGAPSGPPPWATLTFTDVGPDQVLLTLSGGGIIDPEFISQFSFDYNPSKLLSDLSFSLQNGVPFASVSADANSEKAGPIHTFDVSLDYATSNKGDRFGADAITEILISAPAGDHLSALDFDFSTPYNNLPSFAAAHVQGVPGDGGSGWIDGTGATVTKGSSVPEPASMLLMSLGVAGLGLGRRLRKKMRKTG